jgi:hypothetical protein
MVVATRAMNIEEEDLLVEPTEEEEEPALDEIDHVVQVLMKRAKEQNPLSLALKKGGVFDVTELLLTEGRFENISFTNKNGVASKARSGRPSHPRSVLRFREGTHIGNG